MKRIAFGTMPVSQLVEQFTDDALKQFKAELNDEIAMGTLRALERGDRKPT